jgi:Kef-type K+ transport system membrane component KefB
MVAHVGGYIASKIGVPPMVGELCGGILLGATVLKRVWPEAQAWLIPPAPSPGTAASPMLPILGFCSTIGLLVLLFIGGLQLRRLITRRDLASVSWISITGVIVPVAAGLLILECVDFSIYMGTAQHLTALKIVLLIELAITSIPVITRIFLDLGLMNTRLARIVLSVAVIEDVLLYIALSIALGMAQAGFKTDASIPHMLGFPPDSMLFIGWHITASLALLAIAAWGFGGVGASQANGDEKYTGRNIIAMRSPLGWVLASILATTSLAMLLGLAPMFGALVAGIIASNNSHPAFVRAQKQVEAVGTSFFIPIYFTLIGVSLDLIQNFDWVLTFGILVVGCIVKYGGALLGGILAKEKLPMANALAISVNARGGPGLVVASTAFAAGIINPAAYTSLVILAIVTSVFAGIFLARALQTKATLAAIRNEPPVDPDTPKQPVPELAGAH